jgi:predicted MFS family arabinose efflux permease
VVTTVMNDTDIGAAAPSVSAPWFVLATLCVAAFISALNFFATSPFYPSNARDLDTSIPLLGQAITLMLVISAGLGLVVGPFADKYGYRWPLAFGALAIAVNMIGTAGAMSYSMLLGLSIVALASTLFTGDARRRALSWTIASLSVGAIVGIPILTFIGDISSWRVAIGVAGLASLAVTGMIVIVLPPDRRRPQTRLVWRELLDAYTPLLEHPPTLRLLTITGLRAIWFLGMVTYMGAYLGTELDLTTSQVGFVYMLCGLGSTTGGLVAGTGWLKFPARSTIAVTNLVGGALIGLILWSSSVAIVLPLLPLLGLVSAVGGVGVATLLATESPAHAGTTMALNASLLNAGAAAGAAVGGGLLALGGYHAMALGLPVFALFAATLAWWPGPRNR